MCLNWKASSFLLIHVETLDWCEKLEMAWRDLTIELKSTECWSVDWEMCLLISWVFLSKKGWIQGYMENLIVSTL